MEQFRQAFVPTFTFKGRDPQFDKSIPDDSLMIVTASSAPDIIDPATGERTSFTVREHDGGIFHFTTKLLKEDLALLITR